MPEEKKDPYANCHYKFFNHKQCEYFPCHQTNDPDNFNCLFCYCPLYALKDRCGGNFVYHYGLKDCSNCMLPHKPQNYEYIMQKFEEIMEITKLEHDETTKTE